MINIELYIESCKDSNNHILFSQNSINKYHKNLLNMDNARFFILDYLPEKLKDIEYKIILLEKNNILNIKVIFDYNKEMVRNSKIRKII